MFLPLLVFMNKDFLLQAFLEKNYHPNSRIDLIFNANSVLCLSYEVLISSGFFFMLLQALKSKIPPELSSDIEHCRRLEMFNFVCSILRVTLSSSTSSDCEQSMIEELFLANSDINYTLLLSVVQINLKSINRSNYRSISLFVWHGALIYCRQGA